MDNDKYDYNVSESNLEFHFTSVGPNGKVRKVIRYRPINASGITLFNLGFGDYDPKSRRINVSSRTNNRDLDKILATIAASVMEFTSQFPDAMVYAEGSTAARTRLYQMAITSNWDQIKPLLYVFGLNNEEWEPYRKNISYSAFLVKRK